MLRTGGRSAADTGDLGGGNRDPSHMLIPSSNVSNNGTDFLPTNSWQVEYLEAILDPSTTLQ